MRALIFGAGSIGQTYGYILTRSGATVDVYVRPKYAADAESGYRLYERRKGFRDPLEFKPDQVLTTCDEVANVDYDVVVLCISSTALRGDWLDGFAPAVGNTPVVSLTPGMEQNARIAQMVFHRMGTATSDGYYSVYSGEGRE